jgi:hypothetical protein
MICFTGKLPHAIRRAVESKNTSISFKLECKRLHFAGSQSDRHELRHQTPVYPALRGVRISSTGRIIRNLEAGKTYNVEVMKEQEPL